MFLVLLSFAASAQEPLPAETIVVDGTTDSINVTEVKHERAPILSGAFFSGFAAEKNDSEIGIRAMINIGHYFALNIDLHNSALSALYEASWYSAGVGARGYMLSPSKSLRPYLAASTGAGVLKNKAQKDTTKNNGERVTISNMRTVNFSRTDLELGLRFQPQESNTFIEMGLGQYTIGSSTQSDEFINQRPIGDDADFMTSAFAETDAAGYSHWFDAGHQQFYLMVTVGSKVF